MEKMELERFLLAQIYGEDELSEMLPGYEQTEQITAMLNEQRGSALPAGHHDHPHAADHDMGGHGQGHSHMDH